MTIHEIIAEIPRLTIEERLVVLEAITLSLRASIAPKQHVRESLVDRLYGVFKTEGSPLTDQDIDRIRYKSIMDKHS